MYEEEFMNPLSERFEIDVPFEVDEEWFWAEEEPEAVMAPPEWLIEALVVDNYE